MSVQFGRWNFDGSPPCPDDIDRAIGMLVPYGPDGQGSHSEDGLTIVYRAFHTTKESRGEDQPHRSRSGVVVTWDGRLDNRTELRRQLRHTLGIDCPDVLMVAAAYEQWGTECFARLIGDWALSIWSPDRRSLILARDPIGSRHLYYLLGHAQVSWSSLLEPLVLCADQSFQLNEEYLAGWLSFFPAPQLTPYIGIHAVPPSCFVSVVRGTQKVTKYWDFDPHHKIRYRTDEQYEEHFRSVLGEAIRYRLRCDTPVLAELSGGMDSSSIVCMADTIIGCDEAETPRLDTVSYYDDSEPNWNERPYFAKVEEKRGRVGYHIDVSGQQEHMLKFNLGSFAATPGAGGTVDSRFAACMHSGRYRVVLSGVGGDEITGGVPTPTAELEDLLARARLQLLARQLKAWALAGRRPWTHLLLEAMRGFLPPALLGVSEHRRPALWLHPEFVERHGPALTGYESRVKLFGPLPSFQENLSALEMLRGLLGCGSLPRDPVHEKRYPYLDRSLLEFMYAIPREQLVRPGQRRSLMRRALAGIVPSEILQRKRKAFVSRSPMAAIAKQSADLVTLCRDMVSSCLELVDADAFREAIRKATAGQEIPVVTLIRTLDLEFWLRGAIRANVLRQFDIRAQRHSARVRTAQIGDGSGASKHEFS